MVNLCILQVLSGCMVCLEIIRILIPKLTATVTRRSTCSHSGASLHSTGALWAPWFCIFGL